MSDHRIPACPVCGKEQLYAWLVGASDRCCIEHDCVGGVHVATMFGTRRTVLRQWRRWCEKAKEAR